MTNEFKKNDLVKENRMGAQVERVIEVQGNILFTDRGVLHVTKAIKA